MKVRRQHNCTSKHRSYARMAWCVWRRAVWIIGDAAFGCVSSCPGGVTVELYSTADAAQAAKDRIDATGCGSRCVRRHEVIQLVLPS